MARANKSVMFLVHLLIGLYLINIAFSFFEFPESISIINDAMIAIGGVLTIIGGINFVRASKK